MDSRFLILQEIASVCLADKTGQHGVELLYTEISSPGASWYAYFMLMNSRCCLWTCGVTVCIVELTGVMGLNLQFQILHTWLPAPGVSL